MDFGWAQTLIEPAWKIESLSLYPQWQSSVVAWHHSEWLRNVGSRELNDSELAEALMDREESMQRHMSSLIIPTTFIAHDNQHPIGSVSLICYPSSREPDRVWLTNLYVDFPFQRQSIGTTLLAYVEEYAQINNIKEISLYTFDAKEYYLQRGWRWLAPAQLHGRQVDVLSKRLPVIKL